MENKGNQYSQMAPSPSEPEVKQKEIPLPSLNPLVPFHRAQLGCQWLSEGGMKEGIVLLLPPPVPCVSPWVPIPPRAPSPKGGRGLYKFRLAISGRHNGFCSSGLSKQPLLKPGPLHFD